jgi:hypothetical protein
MSHENPNNFFNGNFDGPNKKDLKLSFKDVDLNQITPSNNKLITKGNEAAHENDRRLQTESSHGRCMNPSNTHLKLERSYA